MSDRLEAPTPVTFKGSAADAAQRKADLDAFAKLCGDCLGKKVTIDAAGKMTREAGDTPASAAEIKRILDNLISATGNLQIKVGRNQAGVIIDSYARREIDLADIEQFPATPPADSPSATTRCEVLAHVLGEYKFALHKGNTTGMDGFVDAHKAGYAAQTAHRAARGQAGPCHYSKGIAPGVGETSYCNGSSTVVELEGTTITRVRHKEPSAKPEAKKKNGCFITTAAYGTPTHDVLRPMHAFRDGIVRETRWGRKVFDDWDRVYYRFSPAIADHMVEDPEARELVRTVVVDPWVNYVRIALERPRDWTLRPENAELARFLEALRADIERWADVVPLPEEFPGMSNDAIVDELTILLEVVLRGREAPYLERLTELGVLPLSCDGAEAEWLRGRLRATGRPAAEIEAIVGAHAEGTSS